MVKKAVVVAVVVFGLTTFFLPLVTIQAPMVGTQKISGWDAVKPGQEKPQRREDMGLRDTLKKIRGDFLQRKRLEAPLSVKQAQALGVTLPLAYLALLAGGVLAWLRKPRALQVTAAVGVLAGIYSLLSVSWLNTGLKEMVTAGSSGRGRDASAVLVDALRQKIAAQFDVSSEFGLYLLTTALGALLVASLLPADKR